MSGVCIIGIGIHQFGRTEGVTGLGMGVAATRNALGDAAVVALLPGSRADEAGLQTHVAAALAAFKVPTRILIAKAPLPRNANGKLLKAELRALFDQPADSAA